MTVIKKITVFMIAIFFMFSINHVLAEESIKEIYFTYAGFGQPINSIEADKKTADEIRQSMLEDMATRKYGIIDNKVQQIIGTQHREYITYSGEYSGILNNIDLFYKLSDQEWLEQAIYDYKGMSIDIIDIMYKSEYYSYLNFGHSDYLEAWLFTDDEVYIADLALKEDDLKSEIDIINVRTYKEWQELQVYKPVGAFYINDICIADNVFFNNYEGTIPLRAAIENMGGSVEWDEANCSAYIEYNRKRYTVEYIFMKGGYQSGGLVIKDENNFPIVLGRVSGVGSGFVYNGATYLTKLTATRFFQKLGWNVL